MNEPIEGACPICGFEIGTDDCTCGGLMEMTRPGEPSRIDILVGVGEELNPLEGTGICQESEVGMALDLYGDDGIIDFGVMTPKVERGPGRYSQRGD